jgi:hypothetical protein
MATDSTKITDNFPHKNIPPILDQPTYETIQELHLKLNENAVKVHSNLGNGLLGHLCVTVSPPIFNTLSATPFTLPINPGISPAFPDAATGPVMANIRQVFKEEFAEFKRCMDVCNAISALIIEVIEPVYLAALRLPCIADPSKSWPAFTRTVPMSLLATSSKMAWPCNSLAMLTNPSKYFSSKSKTQWNLPLQAKPLIRRSRFSASPTKVSFELEHSTTTAKLGNARRRRTRLGINSKSISALHTRNKFYLPHSSDGPPEQGQMEGNHGRLGKEQESLTNWGNH